MHFSKVFSPHIFKDSTLSGVSVTPISKVRTCHINVTDGRKNRSILVQMLLGKIHEHEDAISLTFLIKTESKLLIK
jgi:hypothetical protein